MNSWIKQLLMISLIFFKIVQSFCPGKCKCTTITDTSDSMASCIDAALDDVPIQLNPETVFMNLTSNQIRKIDFTLPFYTKLKILDLSSNSIDTLGSKNFEFQKHLNMLNLSYNHIKHLGKDTFKGLDNLLQLNLSYNRIDTIHSSAMNSLVNLIELDLSNNNISYLDDTTFYNMRSLEILIFKNNQLLDVPGNNLMHLKSLKFLDLSENLIETIDEESFQNLQQLVMLNLKGNILTELKENALNGLINLKHLNLEDNNLTAVPTKHLSKLVNLNYLSLSGNQIAQIPGLAFQNLQNLHELRMERLVYLKKIDSRAFVDNENLQKLYLNKNQNFSDMPMRLFLGNPNLYEIYMQENNLKTIDAMQFPIDRLHRLYLGNNPFECNCSLLWLWRLIMISGTGNNNKFSSSTYDNQTKFKKLMENNYTTTIIDETGNSAKHKLISMNDLKLDSDRIICFTLHSSNDYIKTPKLLRDMNESDMSCPANILTIIYMTLCIIIIGIVIACAFIYFKIIKTRVRGPQRDCSIHSNISNIENDQTTSDQQKHFHYYHQPHQYNLENFLNHHHHHPHNYYDHSSHKDLSELEKQHIATEYSALKSSVKNTLLTEIDDDGDDDEGKNTGFTTAVKNTSEHLYSNYDCTAQLPLASSGTDATRMPIPHVVYV